MKHLKLFDDFSDYIYGTKDLAKISVSYLQNDNEVIYGNLLPSTETASDSSWITCTYDMTDVFNDNTQSVTMMDWRAIAGYKINGNYVNNNIKIIDNIFSSVTTSLQTYFVPNIDSAIKYDENPYNYLYKLSRPINFNTDEFLVCIWVKDEHSNMWYIDAIEQADLIDNIGTYLTFHNETTYSFNPQFLDELCRDMFQNEALLFFVCQSNDIDFDNSILTATTLTTTFYNNPSTNVVVDQTMLDENNCITIEYCMPDDINEIPISFGHSDGTVASQCLTSIDFSGLSDKKEWSMPNHNETYLFANCNKLNKINMGNISNVTTRSFYNIRNLTEWIPSNKMVKHDDLAFYECYTSQQTIIFPETLTYLGQFSFPQNTSEFTSITFLSKVPPTLRPSGSSNINFDFYGNYPIYVPAESLEIYKTAELWDYYADRILPIEE